MHEANISSTDGKISPSVMQFLLRYDPARSAQSGLGKFDDLVAASIQHGTQHVEAKGSGVGQFDFRWHGEFALRRHDVYNSRVGMFERALQRRFEVLRVIHPNTQNAHRLRDGCDIGLAQIDVGIKVASGFQLDRNELEQAPVVDDHLDRQVELLLGEQIAEQHRKPAVAPKACGIALAIDP